MIFITLGSQKFQFNRLLKEVDRLISDGVIKEEVYAQIGYSDYKPNNFDFKEFLDRDEFSSIMQKAHLIITHGGTGAIIGAVKKGKKVIAVPRLARHGEHVDDHQIQLVKQFEKLGIIEPCYNCSDLGKRYNDCLIKNYRTYNSNTETLLNSIDNYICKKQIKVLMVGNSPKVKGGITSVINQINCYDWKKENIEMRFISTYIDKNSIYKYLYFLIAYIKIWKDIKIRKPDIVHIHMSYKGSFWRKNKIHKLCKKNDIKTIVHLHGSEFKKWFDDCDIKKQNLIRNLMIECKYFIVLGKNWNDIIKKIEPRTNILTLCNTVKIPDDRITWNNSPFRILFLGVLIKRKGVVDLLESINILINELNYHNIELIITGTGSEYERLQKLTNKYGLLKKVKFLGWVSGKEKQDIIKSCQLLVLPSYNEGMPIAILESMSYGMPVISTKVGDIPSLVSDGNSGYLCEPGDILMLTKKIEEIIKNKEIFLKFSNKSRQIIEETYSEKIFFETLSKCYKMEI